MGFAGRLGTTYIKGRVKIYTKTGDAGETGLFDGERVSKSDPRVDAYGQVDELNAWLGVVRAQQPGDDITGMIVVIQRALFAVGASLADPRSRIAARVKKTALDAAEVKQLEDWIDALEAELSPLRRFILAGGAPAGAFLHLARTVCRRAERRVVALGSDVVDPVVLTYLNRVSDLLFVMARAVNRRAGVPEIEW
jgi:cob(I)alamin adenosyltransferase